MDRLLSDEKGEPLAATTAGLAVNAGGLHAVAAQLAASSQTLAALAVDPMIHPPLATDETSGSVAARLSEYGVVMASRAADGAAVLNSAATAITQAVLAYAAMDATNREVVALQGNPSLPPLGATPAIIANVVAADVPMVAPLPRPGEVTAAIMEAGRPDAGAGFVASCRTLSKEFRSCGATVRVAAGTVSDNLQGQAGLRITKALSRFADWTQAMADHADVVVQWATDHKARFAQTQYETPKTTDFAHKRRELSHATALFASHPGPATAAAVSHAHTALTSLNNRTLVVATGYRNGELPATPPGPPPVVPIVHAYGNQGDSQQSASQPQQQSLGPNVAADGDGSDVDGGELGLPAGPISSPGGQALPSMASALPTMLTGALGGMIGAAVSIPQGIGQQVQGLASQAMQGLDGLASGLSNSAHELDPHISEPVLGYGDSEGGGDKEGYGGVTAPAGGGAAHLSPVDNSMFAMSAPPTIAPALAGSTGPAIAGAGGAPMMMPMGGGMAAGTGAGTRAVKEPDKTITIPAQPNSEPVKGEVIRRHTAVVEDTQNPVSISRPASVAVTSRRRRIDVPKDGESR